MNLTTPPPDKLSDLLELAIADARKLDRTRYRPLWMFWHEAQPASGKCMICLAGAVIAGTLGCAPETTVDIGIEEDEDECMTITHKKWRQALCALDYAREGSWFEALRALNGSHPDKKGCNTIPRLATPTETGFNSWKKLDAHLESLTRSAKELREAGL